MTRVHATKSLAGAGRLRTALLASAAVVAFLVASMCAPILAPRGLGPSASALRRGHGERQLVAKSSRVARLPAIRVARGKAPRASRHDAGEGALALGASTPLLAAAAGTSASALDGSLARRPAAKTHLELMVFLN